MARASRSQSRIGRDPGFGPGRGRQCRRSHAAPGALPGTARSPADIPGMEFAGEVVGLGPGTSRWSIGDRVMSITGGGGPGRIGGRPGERRMAVPDGITWDQAGGFPEVFCTAYDALFTQAHLGAGERVLISGAAGGVGSAAVQLAHAAAAHVVASVRSASRHPEVRSLGADEVVEPDQARTTGPTTSRWSWSGRVVWRRCSPSWPWAGAVVVIGVAGPGPRSK